MLHEEQIWLHIYHNWCHKSKIKAKTQQKKNPKELNEMLISGTLDDILDIEIFSIVANYYFLNLEVHLEVQWITIYFSLLLCFHHILLLYCTYWDNMYLWIFCYILSEKINCYKARTIPRPRWIISMNNQLFYIHQFIIIPHPVYSINLV